MPSLSYNEHENPNSFKAGFALRLSAALNKQGMNQAELARLLGLSRATVSRWMTEYPNIPSKKLEELSQLLNVSLNWLLLGVHTPDRPIQFDLNCYERQILLLVNDLESDLKDHFMNLIREMERKRASTLSKIRLKSDRIIASQKLPVTIIDVTGNIIYANQHHNDYFGATALGSTLVGRSIYEIVPDFSHGSVRLDIVKALLKGYTRQFRCTGKRLDTGLELSFTVYARIIETAEQATILAVIFPEA